MWLEAIECYVEHTDSINDILFAINSEEIVSIDTTKTVACDNVKNDLSNIQHSHSCIIKSLTHNL